MPIVTVGPEENEVITGKIDNEIAVSDVCVSAVAKNGKVNAAMFNPARPITIAYFGLSLSMILAKTMPL